jgi:hypothetical protein
MSNNIRACFCLPEILQETHLRKLLSEIKVLNCIPIGEQIYNEGYWIEQKLNWTFGGESWAASFIQINYRSNSYSTFTFDLDAESFLPKGRIAYHPGIDPKFAQYKNLLIQIIQLIYPRFGEIDYEADLICSELGDQYPYNIASWGNYFPSFWINGLDLEVKNKLFDIVDEIIPIDNLGFITFIHPMEANRAWSNRHKRLEDIIKKHKNF